MADLRMFDDSSPSPSRRHLSRREIAESEKASLLSGVGQCGISNAQKVLSRDEPPPFLELTSNIKKWSTIILMCSYVLIFLSTAQVATSLFVLYEWPELKTLKYAAVFLGCVDAVFTIITTSALRGAHIGNFLTKSHVALEQLSFFFNMGILFSIIFFVFPICLLYINSNFWSTNVFGLPFYFDDNDNAAAQIHAVVIGFVASSFASCLVCILCMVGCLQIRPDHLSSIINDQTFLWLTLVSGMCGSFTLSISIYATTELTHLFTYTTQNAMHALGIALLGMSILSLGRFSISKDTPRFVVKKKGQYGNKIQNRKSGGSPWVGRIHVTILISLAVVAGVLGMSFLINAQNIKPIGDLNIQPITLMKEQSPKFANTKYPFAGMDAQIGQEEAEKIVEAEVEEVKRKEKIMNAFTTKMQYCLLGSFMLVVSLYTLADGVTSSKIKRFQSI